MISIQLEFKKSVIALAGNPYGKQVFQEQVQSVLDSRCIDVENMATTDEKIEIVFPDQITYATSSFIQGFFDYWLTTIGYDMVHEIIEISSVHESVVQNVWSNIG